MGGVVNVAGSAKTNVLDVRPTAPRTRTGGIVALVLTVLAILAVTELPYVYAYRSAPADKVFMGILLNVPDTAQYFSWARESMRSFFIENKLTPEHGTAVFFNLYWLVIGRLAGLFRIGIPDATRLMRWMSSAVFLGAMYWFVSLFAERRIRRWVTYLVLALGGGLGWVLVFQKQVAGALAYPLDLYVGEANTFLTVLAFPLQAMAGGLLLVVLALAALAFERQSYRLAIGAGLIAIGIGVSHGYDLLIVYAVVGTTTILLALRDGAWRRWLTLALAICAWSAPAALYLVLLTRLSPIWRGVLSQYGNAGVFAPTPYHLVILMGAPLLLLLATRGDGGTSPAFPARELILRSWLVVGLLLLYVPTNFQIKMLGLWQVPVGILATRVLFEQAAPSFAGLVARGKMLARFVGTRQPAAILGVAFVLIVLPTNLYLLSWRFVDLHRHTYPYYLYRDEVAAMDWLRAHADRSDVVLSSLAIGEYVPTVSGNNAFLAHWAETLDYYGKQRLVATFFSAAETDSDRAAILARYNVRYVIYGEQEQALGPYNPDESPLLVKVFASPKASVYRVRDAVSGGGQGG
jgi:hypothetical protein